jgi:hypothetical protein
MKQRSLTMPVFALDESTDWDLDLLNALDGSVEYQSRERGRILPLFCFAPMTTPANPDRWEPLRTPAENLLVVSIERSIDARVLKALELAARTPGFVLPTDALPQVRIDHTLLIADAYRQMSEAQITALHELHYGKDDMSFFCLRGRSAVTAFDKELRKLKS